MKKAFILSLMTVLSMTSLNSFACEHHGNKKNIVSKAKTASSVSTTTNTSK